MDLDKLDARILIEAEEAFYWTRKLLTHAGVFVGVSSGATFATAIKLQEKLKNSESQCNIVVMLADGGWKYLSTSLWTKAFADMKENVEHKIWW